MEEHYIFGHRGAMGYCIENTISCFRKAVQMGAGIETDLRITRDKKITCFHDPYVKINTSKYEISKLTLQEIKNLPFKDKRTIPTLEEVFEEFGSFNNNLYFSFDISDKYVGKKAIELAKEYSLIENILITDQRLSVLAWLRKNFPDISLVHTLPFFIKKINLNHINIKKLKKIDIFAINIRNNMYVRENFKILSKNQFNVFVWNVNLKKSMKTLLQLEYNGKKIKALYTDYPDILNKYKEKLNNIR
ncbi:MAG: glycerophosphodiester phosphodiesterase [Promethearchaeota archaeon]